MAKPWSYILNPFDAATKKSYKKAYDLSMYTYGALKSRQADPFFNVLFNEYQPLHQALVSEYVDWLAQRGSQKGATAGMDQLLFQLGFGNAEVNITSKIYDWDLQVQGVFRKNTPEYVTLLPDGRYPFQNGDKDERISAVESLRLSLSRYPALAATEASVAAFYTSLKTARALQEGHISNTGADSKEVEAARKAAMTGLFSVYGKCIGQFAAQPTAVEPLFNISLLRDLPQKLWTGTIDALTTKNIAKRTLPAKRMVKYTVLSAKALHFSVVDEKNDAVVDGFVVGGEEDETRQWGQVQAVPTATYLKVMNPDAAVQGQFKVEILGE